MSILIPYYYTIGNDIPGNTLLQQCTLQQLHSLFVCEVCANMTDKGGVGFNAWIGGSLAYHVLLTLALFAGAFHFNHRLGILERQITVQCVNAAKHTPQHKVSTRY